MENIFEICLKGDFCVFYSRKVNMERAIDISENENNLRLSDKNLVVFLFSYGNLEKKIERVRS